MRQLTGWRLIVVWVGMTVLAWVVALNTLYLVWSAL